MTTEAMQTEKKELTKHSEGLTLINYHVNLNCDMQTSNTSSNFHTIVTLPEEMNLVDSIPTDNIPSTREPSVFNEDLSGKSNNNRYFSNHDVRTGYSSSIVSTNGEPHGNSHALDTVVGVQNDRSKGCSSGDEAAVQTLKAHGKPNGNDHATGKLISVNPTLVPTSSNPVLKQNAEIFEHNNKKDL